MSGRAWAGACIDGRYCRTAYECGDLALAARRIALFCKYRYQAGSRHGGTARCTSKRLEYPIFDASKTSE